MPALKNIGLVFLLCLTIAVQLADVRALGIGPPLMDINFQPNTEAKYDFIVANSLDEQRQIDLYVAGDDEAAKYVKLSEYAAILKPKESRGFSFTTSFPDKMTPGQHKIRVGAVEHTASGGLVGARVGVEIIVLIEVPLPGRYLTIDRFDVQDSRVGRPALLNLILTNKGKEKINNILAVSDILNARGEKAITTVLTFSGLEPTKSTTLSMLVKTDDFPAGKYRAKASVDYDGLKVFADTEFRVRDLLVNILKIRGENIKKDQIGKILVDFESLWDGDINNIKPTAIITKDGVTVAQLTGEDTSVRPYGANTATIYWDTHGLEAGAYGVEATLFYGNKTATGQDIVIISSTSTTTIALIIVALALIVLSYLFVGRRRRR
jgi:hypothetical protein